MSRADKLGANLSHGRYQVRSKLGEGGMGFVYRAWDLNLETDVVIKVPRPAMLEEPGFAKRFAEEIRALVKLSHPHIVKVLDVGSSEGLTFAVMDFLSGGSLEDRRGGHGAQPMPPASLRGWLPQVAGALDFVHGKNYVHRDVKPANILFDASGNAYLSDFGVVKALAGHDGGDKEQSLTGTGLVLGTPHYMAPELVLGQAFDGRIDQYALAVTIYEVLAGRRPIDAPSPGAVLVQQTLQQPMPLTQLCAVSEQLSQAVARGLAKDPRHRFASCSALKDAVLAGLDAQAAAPPYAPHHTVPTATMARVPTRLEPIPSGGLPATASYPPGLANLPNVGPTITPAPRRRTTAWGTRVALGSFGVSVVVAAAIVALSLRSDELPDLVKAPPPGKSVSTSGDGFASLFDHKELSRKLSKIISDLETRATTTVDVEPLLTAATYHTPADFNTQLNTLIASHRQEHTAHTEDIKTRLERVEADIEGKRKLLKNAPRHNVELLKKITGSEQELDDLEKDARIRRLKVGGASVYPRVSASAQRKVDTELALLTELERSLPHWIRPTLDSAATQRCRMLAASSSEKLGQWCFLALIRTGDSAALARARQQLASAPAPLKGDICRSLIISGDPAALEQAFETLRNEPDLLAGYDGVKLAEAIERQPQTWQPILGVVLAQQRDPELAKRVFHVAAELRDQACLAPLERLCLQGSLKPVWADVLQTVVARDWRDAYPVMRTVLGKTENEPVEVPGVTTDALVLLGTSDPQLASQLAVMLFNSGNAAQVRWSVDTLCGDRADAMTQKLDERLSKPTKIPKFAVCNELLRRDTPAALRLATMLLDVDPTLPPDELDTALIGRRAIADASLNAKLRSKLSSGGARGQAWVFDQEIGPQLSAELQRFVDANVAQLAFLNKVIADFSEMHDLEEALKLLPEGRNLTPAQIRAQKKEGDVVVFFPRDKTDALFLKQASEDWRDTEDALREAAKVLEPKLIGRKSQLADGAKIFAHLQTYLSQVVEQTEQCSKLAGMHQGVFEKRKDQALEYMRTHSDKVLWFKMFRQSQKNYLAAQQLCIDLNVAMKDLRARTPWLEHNSKRPAIAVESEAPKLTW